MVQVWARDPGRIRRGLLTVLDAKCVLRESGVGNWTITIDENHPGSPRVEAGWGVVVVEDEQVLFSGPIESIATSQDGQARETTLSGVTDMCVLADRLVLPDPARASDAQTTVAYWARKGPAETLIADLINLQCGPANPFSTRRTAGLASLVSQGRGPVSSVNARYSTVLEEVQVLATVGGLVVDVAQAGTDLVPVVRTRADRSRSVRFQPGTGLSDYDVAVTSPSTTVVLVAGQGEGTARKVLFRSQSSGWGRRVEVFQDRRDTEDNDELSKAAAETLAEGAESASTTFTVAETADVRFGTHFWLGDTVTVALPGGGEVVDGVRAAEIAWDPHGRTVELTVGAPGTEPLKTPGVVTRTKKLMRQVRGLETRR
ncbi:Gp37-like protein [Kocuria rosea]|uniref:Gp37-like protein n=1 Tax=Kocuria rosea TaxID=1275 RepID=UPI003D3362AC